MLSDEQGTVGASCAVRSLRCLGQCTWVTSSYCCLVAETPGQNAKVASSCSWEASQYSWCIRDQGILGNYSWHFYNRTHFFLALKDLKTFVNHSDIVIIAYSIYLHLLNGMFCMKTWAFTWYAFYDCYLYKLQAPNLRKSIAIDLETLILHEVL